MARVMDDAAGARAVGSGCAITDEVCYTASNHAFEKTGLF